MAVETYSTAALIERDKDRKRTLLTLGGSGLVLSSVLLTGCGGSSTSQPTSESHASVPAGSMESPANRAPADIGKKVIVPNSEHTEIVEFKVPYFIKWYNVESPAGKIPVNTRITVDCVEHGSGMATAPDMYHITGPNEYATLFAAANDFWNQANPHPPDLDHKVDPAVPDCH